MSTLADRECAACQGEVAALAEGKLAELQQELGHGWRVVQQHHLEKEFKFKKRLRLSSSRSETNCLLKPTFNAQRYLGLRPGFLAQGNGFATPPYHQLRPPNPLGGEVCGGLIYLPVKPL